jgi:hypothetical protein
VKPKPLRTVVQQLRRTVSDPKKWLENIPWWIRAPAGLAGQYFEANASAKKFARLSTDLANVLTEEEIASLTIVRQQMLDLLAEDRIENGGWGKRNNRTLRTFFGGLPEDFDTEGSITLTRWVVDAIAFSRLNADQKRLFLDDKLVAYLDSRYDRNVGASGRLGTLDIRGCRPIQIGPRHTATSILCYIGFDLDRFRHSAVQQLPYLLGAYARCVRDPKEVGHPDILRALHLSWFYLFEENADQKNAIAQVLQDGFSFIWDWLNSPSTIQDIYGPAAQLWLKLYSLCSICDLAMLPGSGSLFSPLQSYGRKLGRDIVDFCQTQEQHDHRSWGFLAMLTRASLFLDEGMNPVELKALLFVTIKRGGDFRDGFCVYWAVLFSVLDSILGARAEGSERELTWPFSH